MNCVLILCRLLSPQKLELGNFTKKKFFSAVFSTERAKQSTSRPEQTGKKTELPDINRKKRT